MPYYLYLNFALTIPLSLILIAGSVLLIRRGEVAPWVMLAGAVVTFFGRTANIWLGIIMSREISAHFPSERYQLFANIGMFGSLLFGIGLILTALKHRRLHARLKELENILGTQNLRPSPNATRPEVI